MEWFLMFDLYIIDEKGEADCAFHTGSSHYLLDHALLLTHVSSL